jgi:uncharacterized protein
MAAKKVKVSKTVLITGATGGIGLELAKVFANHRHHLILVGRSRTKLLELQKEIRHKHKIQIDLVIQDMISPDAAQAVYNKIKKTGRRVEVLVNSAGFAVSGKFTETSLDDELQEIQLNVSTLTILTKLFAKEMAERGNGKILNVASTAAFFPGPLMAVYYATKAYVVSFSMGLSEELRSKGVQVSVLCPGPTDTEFAKNAGMTESRLFRAGQMHPKKVAEAAYAGLMKKDPIIIPGGSNQAMVFLSRFVPRTFQAKLVNFTHQPK